MMKKDTIFKFAGAALLIGAAIKLGTLNESADSCVSTQKDTVNSVTKYYNSCSKPIEVGYCEINATEAHLGRPMKCQVTTANPGQVFYFSLDSAKNGGFLREAVTIWDFKYKACFAPQRPYMPGAPSSLQCK